MDWRTPMRAITYTRPGEPSVLELAERPIPEPVEGEVRIRVLVSGVNPTDWKSRSGAFGGASGEPVVPNHDGAGIVDEVGAESSISASVTAFGSPSPATAARPAAPPRSTPSSLRNASFRCRIAPTSTSAPASGFPRSPRAAR